MAKHRKAVAQPLPARGQESPGTMNQTSDWPEEVYGLGNRKRCRLPIRLSGGVFGQPVAGKPHFRERLLSKGNQATSSPENTIFRRLLAISRRS